MKVGSYQPYGPHLVPYWRAECSRGEDGLDTLRLVSVGFKSWREDGAFVSKTMPASFIFCATEVQQNANPFLDDLVRSGHFLKRPLSSTFYENWRSRILTL